MPTEFEGTDYELFAELVPRAGCTSSSPINCLLFITEATLLVSGGDDQIVRLWEVDGGQCVQELRDPRWGQITALSWLPENLDRPPRIFIGTGRGSVSTHPFSIDRIQLIRHAGCTVAAFETDDSIEVQALDISHLRFAVASHSGRIQMFDAHDPDRLLPLWCISVHDIPRALFFSGDASECLTIHTCCDGKVLYIDAEGGEVTSQAKLRGGIGSAAISTDGRMKAVYNLSNGTFDLYRPMDSSAPIESKLGGPGSGFIKLCIFAEEGHTLVCAGDNATVHLFQLGEMVERKSLLGEGPDAFYAVTAYSTLNYHFIAAGETEEPAKIYIWRRPTQKRAAENRTIKRLEADKNVVANQAAKKARETRFLKERLNTTEALLHRTNKHDFISWSFVGFLFLLGILLLAWR